MFSTLTNTAIYFGLLEFYENSVSLSYSSVVQIQFGCHDLWQNNHVTYLYQHINLV